MLDVLVQPRAGRDEVAGLQSGRIKVRMSAPPVAGAANARLKAFMAKEFGVSSGRVRLVSGETGRRKRLAVSGPRKMPDWLA